MGYKDCYLKKIDLSAKMKELAQRVQNQNGESTKSTANKLIQLFATEAGKMAQEMDNADGNVDNKISASVWNKYVEGHEGRTAISENATISVFDAMDSITTYMAREEAQENGPNATPTEKDDPNVDYD